MLTRVLSDSIRSIGILVVALRMVLRDADILVHVESLHIFEAYFASLVSLPESKRIIFFQEYVLK